MMPSRVIYFDHEGEADSFVPPFQQGEAGFVWLDEGGDLTSDTQVIIPPNSVHAMKAHGVIDQINGLGLAMGLLGQGGEAVVMPGTVEDVTRIFYDADRMTYGQVHDLQVGTVDEVEYRLVVNNREYQRTLSRLQFLSGTASRMGRGLRLQIG